jgi:DNA-binding LacI/PurR family transcriptional regulator
MDTKVRPSHRIPGRRATARDVAELAGVSISAVSRAFTRGASISSETRTKVLEASRRLGYQPNLLARSLMTRRTEMIGLISNNFDNPFFMQIFDLFTRSLQDRGLRPLLANLTDGTSPAAALDMLLQYSVDGVIIASSSLHRELADACVKAQLPVVQAFGRRIGRSAVDVVGADNVQGGRLAGDLLLARGYRRVAFLGGPLAATSTGDRLRGLRARLLEDGLQPVAEVFGRSFSYDEGKRLMRALLCGERIDAVFCGDDILAIGALDSCRTARVSVPSDIGLVGFDDMPMASWAAYDLTTIRQPVAEIIGTAVELIVSAIDRPDLPSRSCLLPCEVVARGTLRRGSLPRESAR